MDSKIPLDELEESALGHLIEDSIESVKEVEVVAAEFLNANN